MNDNQALLDWAVANIEQWDENYTHLRGDESDVCYTVGPLWGIARNYWWDSNEGVNYKTINEPISCALQVITKEEWEAAKKAKTKSFTKADLKTGMILEFNNGGLAMVLRGTANGDIISGQAWKPLSSLVELGFKDPDMQLEHAVKVYQPETNMDYLSGGKLSNRHPVIWEFDSDSEKRRELEEQVQEQQAKLKELG